MKKKFVRKSLCLLIVLALCLSYFVPLIGYMDTAFATANGSVQTALSDRSDTETEQTSPKVTTPVEQSEGVVRPEDIDEGLSLNSLKDIRGRRLTVRQPIMEIVKDNVARQPAEVMPNEYEMLDFKTGDPLHKLAKINFASNSELQPGNKDHPMYPMKGLDRSPKDSNGNVTEQKYFSTFTKYMLLRQAYYFNTHVTDIINKNELKKHPAADYIYGKIPDEATAVTMHIVTDPIYRSPMTTGLYLVPGEVATVKIKGLKAGEAVTLYTHHQDTMGYLGYDENGKGFGKMEDYLEYWDKKIVAEAESAQAAGRTPNFEQFNYGIHGQWLWQNQKVPCMGTTFTIVGTGEETEVKIGSMYGGPLYVKPTSTAVDMEISGAVLTPHFVLGVTTIDEFNKQLRNAPGLIATLDVENGQLIGPAEDMRNCDDMEKLAYFWHSVFAIDISLNGRDYNYNMTMCYDMHVPAGEAVALNSNFCAQPEYWFPICMNYETLTTKGNWGTFHELGHVQAKTHGVNWGFCDGDGEVWNNTLILLIYSMLCNMDSRVIGVEHGEYVHPFTAIERSQKITKEYKDKTTGEMRPIEDYGMINEGNGAHFDQLSMYATLLHSFGPEKFVDMFYTYKMNPAYCSNKRADFVYRIGVVDRVNILNWVNKNYFARITDDMFTDGQLDFLRNLPDFVPVAYRWANGIDGNETARKHDVDGKNPTVFDVSRSEFSSPGDVEIVTVTNAQHGNTKYDPKTNKVTYTPPKEVTEYDRFDIIVKTSSGRRVTLNVNLRLLYRGVYTEVWCLGTQSEPLAGSKNPTIEVAQQFAKDNKSVSTETGNVPGKGDFNHAELEYFHSEFKFRATQSGEHTFYVRVDDQAIVNFYKGGNDASGDSTYKIVSKGKYNFSLSDTSRLWTVDLKKNDIIFITADLVNWGGPGNLHIGLRMPDQTYKTDNEIKDIPIDNIIGPDVSNEDLEIADTFKGWQPRFVDSIKNATIDYQGSKQGWKVLEAPDSEPGCSGDNLVDGDESISYHSRYNHGTGRTSIPTPHVFVIDTRSDQTFNYFDIIRRTNGNDKLLSYELYSCTEDEYATEKAVHETDSTTGWTKLFEGESSNVNAAKQRISFARTQLRYFKLIITANSGHTVIREVYAGIESKLNQTVKPSNYMTSQEGFTENSANGKLSTEKTNSTYEFKFLGSGFELYADTDPSYGKASVTIDDEYDGEINLGDVPLFNKQVYIRDDLETREHKVVVTTLDDNPFNISFINVKYGTPVTAEERPADKDEQGNDDYGDQGVARQFIREWKTYVKDYKTLESIRFLTQKPDGYKDTYVRIDTYIRLYRSEDGKKIAFVYPGKILAPIECASLFSGCEKLTELDLENFDTTYMRGAMSMFYGCSSLTNLDVSGFATENVLSFGKMFGDCTSLEEVDLSEFELDKDANLYQMFENCGELRTIKLPNTVEVKRTMRSGNADEGISFDLPYVYNIENTDKYITELVLNDETAGKKLILHDNHDFSAPGCLHEVQNPTCEETGLIAYKTCTICKRNFDYNYGKTLYSASDLIIPANGHNTYTEYDGSFPSCTKSGGAYTLHCYDCGKIVGTGEVIPAVGHSYALDTSRGEPIEGSDQKTGYSITYSRREEIEKTEMVDENGDVYFTQEELVVKGIATVTVYLKCLSYRWDLEVPIPCDHMTEVTIEFESDVHTEANCTEAETFFYNVTVDEATLTEAMLAQDDDDIDDGLFMYSVPISFDRVAEGTEVDGGSNALGHDFEKVEAVAPTCEGAGSTEGRKCALCGLVENVKPIAPLEHDMEYRPKLEPTCTEAGHEAGLVCTRCGHEGTGVKHIEPLGHDFTVDIEGEAPTCTQIGHEAGKKCSRCDAIEGHDVIDDLGHEVEIIPGKAPTETESGLTDGKRCSRCGEILEEQHEIPPLGSTVTPPEVQPNHDGKSGLNTTEWALVGTSIAVVTAGGAASIAFWLRRKRRR